MASRLTAVNPEVAFLRADQKERSLWRQEWSQSCLDSECLTSHQYGPFSVVIFNGEIQFLVKWMLHFFNILDDILFFSLLIQYVFFDTENCMIVAVVGCYTRHADSKATCKRRNTEPYNVLLNATSPRGKWEEFELRNIDNSSLRLKKSDSLGQWHPSQRLWYYFGETTRTHIHRGRRNF